MIAELNRLQTIWDNLKNLGEFRMNINRCILWVIPVIAITFFTGLHHHSDSRQKIKVLIIDGQNNHDAWPKTTFMMKRYLEEAGQFEVDIARTQFTWNGKERLRAFPVADRAESQDLASPKQDPDFNPRFADYDVVISNMGFGAADLPENTKAAFVEYMKQGGGLVVIHAADNAWPQWSEYNQMIGLGGWGGRTEKHGPYVYFNDQGELVRDEAAGAGGSHGPQHDFQIRIRDAKHPIAEGLPAAFMHGRDELYDRLRGPAENMTVIASAYSSPDQGGTGRHEPILMAIEYGQGRVFHTVLGHADYSMESVAFITTFLRGTEWAATGKVTSDVPEDFPTDAEVSKRAFKLN